METAKSTQLIEFALHVLGCNQKELAVKLGVSQAQITIWKKGEAFSSASLEKASELLGINPIAAMNLDVLKAVNGVGNFQLWVEYFNSVVERWASLPDFPFDIQETDLMEYQGDESAAIFLAALVRCKVLFPEVVPDLVREVVDMDFDDVEDEVAEEIDERECKEIEQHIVFVSFIEALSAYFAVYNGVISVFEDGFRSEELEWAMLEYASCYAVKALVDNDEGLDRNDEIDKAVRYELDKAGIKLRSLIDRLVSHTVEMRLPMVADLHSIIKLTPQDIAEDIEFKCEQEAFGFGEPQLHPDIYMNELLLNSRRQTAMIEDIHKALGLDQQDAGEATLQAKVRKTVKSLKSML